MKNSIKNNKTEQSYFAIVNETFVNLTTFLILQFVDAKLTCKSNNAVPFKTT